MKIRGLALALCALGRAALAEGTDPTGKADPAPALRYEAEWIAAQPPMTGDAQADCLAQALYFEARGETIRGQVAVAEVILNRVDSPLFPASVCAVVHQGSGRRNACQFSYTCDGRPETIREREAYAISRRIAALMLSGAPRRLTAGATHFHSRAVKPGWSRSLAQTAAIGAHYFYRPPSA